MAHRITPPRHDLRYAVVDMDGAPLSWHRSLAAAQQAIEAEARRCRRRYPRSRSSSYLPRSIIHCAGATSIERLGRYSTTWVAQADR